MELKDVFIVNIIRSQVHTVCAVRLLGPHYQGCGGSEALHVLLVQGLGVAGAVEVFHESDEIGSAQWCEGLVVGDVVGHCVNSLFSEGVKIVELYVQEMVICGV